MSPGPIDLHIHSAASDGANTPAEIVELAVGKGLGAIALTDHDTVSGLDEFMCSAKAHPELAAVPGVEVSVTYRYSSIHITGLFIDHSNKKLSDLLREIRTNRDTRNVQIIRKLNDRGFKITLEEVEAVAAGESVGRPHFAKILIEKGYFKEPQEVFDKCLKRGAPCYVARGLPTPEEAICAIHEAGGLAFWAHPLHRSESSESYVESVLDDFMLCGLDGIEAYYSTFSDIQQKLLLDTARKYGIMVSGGSDFHGANQPGIHIGTGYGSMNIPYSVYDELLRRRTEQSPAQAQQP